MTNEREHLSLETIQGGAMIEQFDHALGRVLDNLSDINTTRGPREITLTVKIVPNEDRSFLDITGGVKVKLAGQAAVKATADLTMDDHGRPAAYGREKKQLELPFNVTKLNEGGKS